jgi:hypothetical protein
MPRRSLAVIVGSAVALAVAGAATAGTWPKLERTAADQALAKRSILHLSDFTPGSGWTAASSNGASGSASVDDPACKTSAFSDQGRVLTGSASSSFKATGLQVWSSADVMKTVAMAQRDAAHTKSGVVMPCLSAAFAKNLPKTAKLVSVKKLSFPELGDWTGAYRALIDVGVNGTTVRLQVDMVLVRASRVEITLMQMAPFAISNVALEGEVRMLQRLVGPSLSA